MNTKPGASDQQDLIPFDRKISEPGHRVRVIGTGSIGGKAQGLVFLNKLLLLGDHIADISEILVGV